MDVPARVRSRSGARGGDREVGDDEDHFPESWTGTRPGPQCGQIVETGSQGVRVLGDAVTDVRCCLDRGCDRLAGHGVAADGGNDHDHQQHPGEDR